MNNSDVRFFLGSISSNGFAGYYKQVVKHASDGTSVLIKGGPGCGKSTMLKQLSQTLKNNGKYFEYIYCAGDTNSLDGIITNSGMFCVVDATAPHVIEPDYPQAVEGVISLYDALDITALYEKKAEIVMLFERERGWTERAKRYITAAANILQDTARVAMCFTDTEKAKDFGVALSKKYIPQSANDESNESVRLLSAVTANGIVYFKDTLSALAENIIVLDDKFGLAAKMVLSEIRKSALAKGHKIITCYCPLSPFDKIEHIIIPALSLAFTTSNSFLKVDACTRIIHCTRFCNKEGIKIRRARIRFNQKASKELIQQGCEMLSEAYKAHKQLEKIYGDAMDYSKAETAFDKLVAYIER